jgi:hypothetical protein
MRLPDWATKQSRPKPRKRAQPRRAIRKRRRLLRAKAITRSRGQGPMLRVRSRRRRPFRQPRLTVSRLGTGRSRLGRHLRGRLLTWMGRCPGLTRQ